jgi:hypothetical protein
MTLLNVICFNIAKRSFPLEAITERKILYIRGIARKPRPIPAYRCAINVTDLPDIFTVGRSNKVRKKPKMSAQKGEPFSRYRHRKYEGVG